MNYIKIIVVLVLLGVGWVALQSYKKSIIDTTTDKMKIETLKKIQVIKERTKDAVQQNRESNPSNDPNVALERLKSRQQGSN